MQIDMHYYGCYVLARLAGIKENAANVIASASQYVDDSYFKDESFGFDDGSFLQTIITTHNVFGKDEKIENLKRIRDKEKQRYVWVPFHFLPGGEGDSFSDKIICRKNSKISQIMITNILEKNNLEYYNYLVGIAAHVYADTFSHYGFSGLASDKNKVDGNSIESNNLVNNNIEEYIKNKAGKFFEKYDISIPSILSDLTELSSKALGHGGVATYPDRPYLEW